MKIESNIAQVLERVKHLPGRIDAAVTQACQPSTWIDEARELAVRVLQGMATPDQIPAALLLAETITAVMAAGERGFVLRLAAPRSKLATLLEQAQLARAGTNKIDPRDLFGAQIAAFETLVLEWVETPEEEGGKRRDARDWGKTDEEIAHLISYIMLSPNLGMQGLRARAALTPHLRAFIHQKMAGEGRNIDPALVHAWMRAVLISWREWIRVRFPQRVRDALQGGRAT